MYYRLGEPSGTTMNDSSGNGRNGSYSGSPTLGATGLLVGDSDTAVTFASGKYATVAYASWMNVTTVTVEATIKLSSMPGSGQRATILSRDNEISARAFSFEINDAGKLEGLFFIGGSPYFVTGTTTLTTGVIYTVAFKFDGSYAKLYLNGVEDGTLTHSGSLDTTTGVGIYIGCSPYSNRFPFDGTIDDVSYYGSGLSPTRLSAHAWAASGSTPDATVTATLVAVTAIIPFASPPFDATITPDSVAAVGAVPASLLAITVATVAAATSTPSSTPSASSSVTAAVVVATATVPLPPSIIGADNASVTAALVTAVGTVSGGYVQPGPTKVQATATVPTVQAAGQLTLATPPVVAAIARPLFPLYVQDDHVEIVLSGAIAASVGVPALAVAVGVTIDAVSVAAVAATPAPVDTFPPAQITDFTSSVTDLWSVTFTWTNPTDPDFAHVLILRNDGLPWPEPGDDLLDPSIIVIAETNGIAVNNYDYLHAYPIASGDFHDVENTTGRPYDGYEWTESSWYRYTPVADGTVTVDTIGTAFDTYLTVFNIVPDEAHMYDYLTADDDSGTYHGGGSRSSWLQFDAVAGTTYYINAQGYGTNDHGNMYFNLAGPNSSETAPSLSPTYTDSSLVPGQPYYYSFYAVDTTGNASYVGAQAFITALSLEPPAPMSIGVDMLVGSIELAAGTPVGVDPGMEIDNYGYPFKVRAGVLTSISSGTGSVTPGMQAGAVWVNDMIQPPPARPGSQVGFPASLFPPGVTRTDTDIRVEVWDYTNTTKLGDLNYSAAREFLDEYNGVGSGTLQVPAIVDEAALLRRDRVLRFYYKDIPDAVFASVIEGRKTTVVAEAGSHWASVTGRGILAWLEDAVVLPYVDPGDPALPNSGWRVMTDGSRYAIQSNLIENAPDVRAFNFGSRDAPNHVLFDDVGPGSAGSDPALSAVWTQPIGRTYASRTDLVKGYPRQEVKVDQGLPGVPAARTVWPDPSAQWLWTRTIQTDMPDGEQRWFRGFFTVSSQTNVRISGTADNYGWFYLDGKFLFSTNTWQKYWSVGVTLEPGTHSLQIRGMNANAPAVKYSPAAVMATVEGPSGIIFRTASNINWEATVTPQTFATTEANHGPGWHRPLGISQSTLRPLNIKAGYPTDWPDPTAQWIWGSDPSMTSEAEQICYFRNRVNITQAGTYRWFVTADDGYICWVDGIEVLSLDYEGTAANGWMRSDEIDLDLTAGVHVFALRGRNQTNAAQFTARGNPAAVLGTLMTLDGNLKPNTPVPWTATKNTGPNSRDGWFANWSGPAWKAGDVLYTLINEAKGPNRAVTRLTNVTMDFNASVDSNGQPWTTRVSRTWDIGTSLLQVAFDLCELGVDIWMTPDNVLHCAERRGSSTPTFAVTYGINISGYDVDETFAGASVAYTRTRAGWFTLENDTSNIIVGGRRETAISLANTDSEDIMIGISHRAIGSVVMANMVATAQAMLPVTGSIPYVDANISDIIYVLSPNGSQRMGRLLSVSVTENEAGASTWVPEIEIWNSPFGDGVDPNRPHDPPDPNNPYDPSTWVPAAEDWTRFIPAGAGSEYPRAVTLTQADAWVAGGTAQSRAAAVPASTSGATSPADGNITQLSVPSPSPQGATPVPLNSAQMMRPAANAQNNAATPNAERVAVSPTPPKLTAGYHLWVDTSGLT